MSTAGEPISTPLSTAINEAEMLIRKAPQCTNDVELAAGLEYLAGTVRGVTQTVQAGDKNFPYFVESTGPYTKMGLDNPDTLYLHANIRDNETYLVEGQRGTTTDLCFQVLAGDYSASEVPGSPSAFDDRSISIDENGCYELIFGPPQDNPPPNFVALAPGASILSVREVFSDWSTETPGRIFIRRLEDTEPGLPLTLPSAKSVEDLAQLYARIARGITGRIDTWLQFPQWFYLNQKVNTLNEPRITPGGLTTQYSCAGHFEFAEDEAMILTVDAGLAPYAGFQVGNMWYVSMDYIHHQTSLTEDQAHSDPDGKIRLVLAHHDPALANWIELCDHEHGYMQFRWQRVDGDIGEDRLPQVEIVKFSELADRVPYYQDQRITAAQWADRIKDRRFGFARRMRS